MATVRTLVTGRRPRIGGLSQSVAVVGALVALLGVIAALAGSEPAASATAPRLASPGGHGLALRFPIKREGADLCGKAAGLVCTQVVVPLDRTGAVPGSITLHVEQLPADGVVRGTIFLIAGGPGQGSAHVFGLGDPSANLLFRYLFPGYNLVAYDDRGTGQSGLIDCPALQAATTEEANR